jgi:hypothetical protein
MDRSHTYIHIHTYIGIYSIHTHTHTHTHTHLSQQGEQLLVCVSCGFHLFHCVGVDYLCVCVCVCVCMCVNEKMNEVDGRVHGCKRQGGCVCVCVYVCVCVCVCVCMYLITQGA